MLQNKCVSLKHEQQLVKHNDLNHKGLVQYKWNKATDASQKPAPINYSCYVRQT